MELDILIEGLLFYKAAPQKKSVVQKLFAVEDDSFSAALERLRSRLERGATRLIETEDTITLATAPELSEFIATLQKRELSTDIGKAGAETLAIILYKEPVTRGEIDRIRGVNSSFILRNLQTRGLIQRSTENGSHRYSISPELLQHLGVTRKHDLPQFSEFMTAIEAFSSQPS